MRGGRGLDTLLDPAAIVVRDQDHGLPSVVAPAREIESELSGHPAVADVAVFGIPHDDWGEEIKAVVEPVPGTETGPALTEELLAFLGSRVAKFKLPRTIDYVDELPRDPNGKLYKRRLRDPYWEGRERTI